MKRRLLSLLLATTAVSLSHGQIVYKDIPDGVPTPGFDFNSDNVVEFKINLLCIMK